MANMSYCRFENTVNDFYDCIENIDSLNEESLQTEFEAREALIYAAQHLLFKLGLEDLYDMAGFEDCIKELNDITKQSFYCE
jgi:hypothetical protein